MRQSHQKNQFLDELKKEFEAVDVFKAGEITFDQWKNSNFINIICNGQLSQDEFEKYFDKIDANCNGYISWDELVDYLMREFTTNKISKSNAAKFIKKVPTAPILKSQCHHEMIQQIYIHNQIDQYITLSSDSIRFWSSTDLSFKRCITKPGFFSHLIMIPSFNVLTVTTSNRRLLFYDYDTLSKLPISISASPSSNKIRKMSCDDAQIYLKSIKSPQMPLFNIPTSLCLYENDTTLKRSIFFVGDEHGLLEVYSLIAPRRRSGTDYQIQRLTRETIHTSRITQISYISTINCYISSSYDRAIKIWMYYPQTNNFTTFQVINNKSPILGFQFSITQNNLITYGVSRNAYVWTLSPLKKIFKLGGHFNQIQNITNFITTIGEHYIITMSIKKEFRLWDIINYRMIREWNDETILRPEDYYSSIGFDERNHCLITCCSYPIKWAEDINALNESLEHVSHSYQIIGLYYTKEFQEIVSIDKICTFKIWNMFKGNNITTFLNDNNNVITAATIDITGRRVITCSLKNKIYLWNYNSGNIISEVKLSPLNNAIVNILMFIAIGLNSFLIRIDRDKLICAYLESEKGQFDLFRQFKGHKHDIISLTNYNNGIVSGDINGEIFVWSLETNFQQANLKLENSIECLACFKSFILVGDSLGFMYILLLPKLEILEKFDAHSIRVKHSMSVITVDDNNGLVYTADTLGYVKCWEIIEGDYEIKLKEKFMIRCSNDEITSIIIIGNGKFIATCGVDMCIRIWKVDTFDYVGFFHDESNWDLDNPSTYVGKSPFKKDPKHFTEVVEEIPAITGNQKDEVKDDNFDDEKIERNNEEDEMEEFKITKDFDLAYVKKSIDNYILENESRQNKNAELQKILLSPKPTKKKVIHAKELEFSQRPIHLVDSISSMIEQDNKATMVSTPRRPVLRIPMSHRVNERTPISSNRRKVKRPRSSYFNSL